MSHVVSQILSLIISLVYTSTNQFYPREIITLIIIIKKRALDLTNCICEIHHRDETRQHSKISEKGLHT